jgi:hypothetical protein
MDAQPFTATLDARRAGALGLFQPVRLDFRVEHAPHALNRTEREAAAIKAAGQMGWEVNHVVSVVAR